MIPNIPAYPEYGFPHWYPQAQNSYLSYSEGRAIRSFRVSFRVSFRSNSTGRLSHLSNLKAQKQLGIQGIKTQSLLYLHVSLGRFVRFAFTFAFRFV